MNIFGYSFVDFLTTEYNRIFVLKFLKIRIYLNICLKLYFHICLSFLTKKVNQDIVYASKNIQCKILFRGNMSEPFYKITSISDEYKYLNMQIKLLKNK